MAVCKFQALTVENLNISMQSDGTSHQVGVVLFKTGREIVVGQRIKQLYDKSGF